MGGESAKRQVVMGFLTPFPKNSCAGHCWKRDNRLARLLGCAGIPVPEFLFPKEQRLTWFSEDNVINGKKTWIIPSVGVQVGAYSKHEVGRLLLKKTVGFFDKCMNVLCIWLSILSFHCVNRKSCLEFILCNESGRGWGQAPRQQSRSERMLTLSSCVIRGYSPTLWVWCPVYRK